MEARHIALVLAAALAGLSSSMARAEPAPVNNWAEFRQVVTACWTVPPDTGGAFIAYKFGLDKNGAIRGKPLVTARHLVGDKDAQKRYVEAGMDVLARCFPLPVTPSFGAILGESPIYLRLVNTPPTAAYQINNNVTIFAPH